MPSYTLRSLDAETIASAKQRARDAGTSLDAVLRAYLEAYADGVTPAAQIGALGGAARAQRMTATERRESARRAAAARWARDE